MSAPPGRAATGKTAWLLPLLLLGACVAPSDQQPRGQPAEAAAPGPHFAAILAEVRVHLPQHDRAETLEIACETGLLRISRRGNLISDGTREAPSLPFGGPAGVRILGVLHRGKALIEPHPLGGLKVTLQLPIEAYIEGVVAAEISLWSAQPAELEAQAIAARSYALGTLLKRRRRLSNPSLATLEGSTQDQAYRGAFEPDSNAGSRSAARRLHTAVSRTEGQVLFLEGQPLAARYSASCGGHTASLAQVFPSPISAEQNLEGAPCAGCQSRAEKEDPSDPRGPLRWQVTFSRADLRALASNLGIGSQLLRYELGQRDPSGRWLSVVLVGDRGQKEIPADALRAELGHGRLRSTRIVSSWPHAGDPIEAGLQLEGLGHGHGVGLCQEGARDAAQLGWDARRILAWAYPGTELRDLGLPSRP